MTGAGYEERERRRGARHSAVALLIGAMVWIAALPASAQHHDAPYLLANATGLLAAAVMAVLALVMLARTFPRGSRR